MSDQPTPPKPKPGSLRDRIAAFEKPAGGLAAPSPAPVPRPKPGGISWKPRPPSPPSPASTSEASFERKTGNMSASDAKESIKTGGSLKERMAALQNRGGFGAPPPVAPKPPVEKPKWKPPPVIAPVDKDDDDEPSRDADKPKPPPPIRKSTSEEKSTEGSDKVEAGLIAEEGEAEAEGTAEVDPEEEERQRRAAIAARMARLGGARVGMAPVYGRAPPVKKPEPVSEPAESVEPIEEATKVVQEEATSPPSNDEPTTTSESTALNERSVSSDAVDSEPPSSLSTEAEPQAAPSAPTSMPIPTAPRRAAPPRRKAPKSPEVTPPTIISEPIVVSPETVPALDVQSPHEIAVAARESAEKELTGDLEKEIADIDELAEKVETPAASETLEDKPPVVERDFAFEEGRDAANKKEDAVDEATKETQTDEKESSAASTLSPPVGVDNDEELVPKESKADREPPTKESEADEPAQKTVEAANEEELAPIVGDVNKDVDDVHAEEEPTEASAIETEEDEEAARRQRIAEKLAKMGGVNPFALPPQRRTSSSSEDTSTSPPLTKRSSISRPSLPQRKQSSHEPIVESSPAPEPTGVQSEVADDTTPSPPARSETTRAAVTSTGVESEDDSRNPTPTREEIETDHERLTAPAEADEPYEPFEDLSDVEPVAAPLPPIPNTATRPISTVTPAPVDPALPVSPVPRSQDASDLGLAAARKWSVPPPPRLVPRTPEPEENLSESVLSYASSPGAPTSLSSYPPSDQDDDEPPRHLPMRPAPAAPLEEFHNDEAQPLPVPNRRSMQSDDFNLDGHAKRASVSRPSRSIPLPPTISAPVSDVEDSDFDEVLPTRPLRRPDTPMTVPTPSNEVPLIVPPPATEETAKKVEPSPLRQSSYPEPAIPLPPTRASNEEILDEEEGDPIDPSFHSPSRRTSLSVQPPVIPAPAPDNEPEEDEQTARRRTIAERMAKLGGIKFGAAPPIPQGKRPVPPAPKEEEEDSPDASNDADAPVETTELTEEEEERARKERIAAKLAMMGGMRIGMMPLGVGAVRPQASHALTEEPSRSPPSRAVPPTRSPPPLQVQDSDDHENSLSMSQYSNATSDEGVKVEAEDSEIEEVSYADAQEAEEEPEEVPPPVPSRAPRKRGTAGSESEHLSTSPPPPPRPPVPTSSLPTRRASAQSTTSTVRRPSADSSHGVQKPSTYKPSSEYVMVEEPSGFVPEEETPPPPPPARPSHRPPPRSPPPPPPPPPSMPISDSISSQWEMPSIPSSSIEFTSPPDISLTWPEDPSATSSSRSPTLPPPPPPPTKPPVAADVQLSPDELMTVWGRVGVQICEVATTLFDKSKKSLVGDGTYNGFINAVLSDVPNAATPSSNDSYGYLVYLQTGNAVQKRASEILPGDIMLLQDAKLKGHKGLQSYHQNVGIGQPLVGVISEFEPKKSKVRLFQANQHVGQQTVEAVSYRLEDLKSGTVKVFRVLEN